MAETFESGLPTVDVVVEATDDYVIRRGDKFHRTTLAQFETSTIGNNVIAVNYLSGNETTDGSVRDILIAGETVGTRQRRSNGVWNASSIRVGSDSLEIDLDLSISGLAGYIETVNPSQAAGHRRSILPHIEFDDTLGTTASHLHVPIANLVETFVVFSTAVSETTATTIGQQLGVSPGRSLKTSIHEVGTTGATAQVTVNIFTGSDNTGTKVSSINLPASDIVAGTTLSIDYGEVFGFDEGVSYFQEFVSTVAFSLKTDLSGNILTTHVGNEFSDLDGLTENMIYDNNLDHLLDSFLNPIYLNQF